MKEATTRSTNHYTITAFLVVLVDRKRVLLTRRSAWSPQTNGGFGCMCGGLNGLGGVLLGQQDGDVPRKMRFWYGSVCKRCVVYNMMYEI